MERDLTLFCDGDHNRAAVAYQRMPEDEVSATVWCKNIEEAIGVLKDYSKRLRKVYLEHDFEGQSSMNSFSELSGMEAVRFLEKQNPEEYRGCKFQIHTHNVYAGNRMMQRLTKVGYDVQHLPFGM